MKLRTGFAAMAAVAALAGASGASAADEEIQVYMDEMGAPHHFGLDVHSSYVLDGDRTPGYAGEQQSVRRLRITPEWSYAVTSYFELGAYLPLTTLDHDGKFNVAGEKLRLKFIAPHPADQSWFWGLNFEIGKVQHRLDQNPWNAELKTILGARTGPWTLAVNGNLDWKVSGPISSPATFDVSTKAAYAVSHTTSIGIESYNGFGEVRHLGRFKSSDQETYAVVDTALPHGFDLNLGLGHGYGTNSDGWIVKAVVGVPIDN